MAVEDDGLRLHAAGNIAACFDIGRVLHGDKDDVDVLFFLQFVGRSGDGFLIGIVVLPVADGNAQAPADAGDAVLLQDVQADVLVDGMHGQDGIGRHVDRWFGHAHGSQFSLGIGIADADDGDALQDLAHGPAGFGTADGTDTLGIEHDRLLEEQGYFHDPQVIIEAAGTGHVLQEAATAAYKNITAANSRCDSEEVQAVYSLYVMVFPGHAAVAGDDRNGYVGNDVFQGADNGSQHGFVAGIGKAVIAGNDDSSHDGPPAFPATSSHS